MMKTSAKQKFLKRAMCLTMTVMLLGGMIPLPAQAVDTSATAAILIDAYSGRVLYEKNPDKKMLIASTTKIMTALTAIQYGVLTDTVTVSRNAANTEGSSMYLRAGQTLTLETLLYGLLLLSGNDAGVAIAEHISGSVSRFVDRMNEIAQGIGMTNSSFANPHGLDHKNNYSTARDMAKLAAFAMENPVFRRICSTRTITIGGRSMTNHNKLLSMVEGCVGVKNGYTRASGRTLVTCVERNGRRLIVVTLQDGNDYADHQKLYDYGFSTFYTERCVAYSGQYIGEVPVEGGLWPTVPVIAESDLYCPLAEEEQPAVWLRVTQTLTAPVQAGTYAGEAVYYVNGVEIGRVGMICGETIPANQTVRTSGTRRNTTVNTGYDWPDYWVA